MLPTARDAARTPVRTARSPYARSVRIEFNASARHQPRHRVGARARRPRDRRADVARHRDPRPSSPSRRRRAPEGQARAVRVRVEVITGGLHDASPRRRPTCRARSTRCAAAAASAASGVHVQRDPPDHRLDRPSRSARRPALRRARRARCSGWPAGCRSSASTCTSASGPPEKAIPIVNALTAYVPHFLALSASSPVLDRRRHRARVVRGARSSRACRPPGCRTSSRTGASSSSFMETLISADTIETIREVWWDIRPHPELRHRRAADLRRAPDAGGGRRGRRAGAVPGRAVRRAARPRLHAAACRELDRAGEQVAGRPLRPRRRDRSSTTAAPRRRCARRSRELVDDLAPIAHRLGCERRARARARAILDARRELRAPARRRRRRTAATLRAGRRRRCSTRCAAGLPAVTAVPARVTRRRPGRLAGCRARRPDLIAFRRDLHAHPELGLRRARARPRCVADQLPRRRACDPRVLPGGTGLMCDIGTAGGADRRAARRHRRAAAERRARTSRTARRSPASATPAVTTCTPRSCSAPRLALVANRDRPGRVRLLFQPAEEAMPGGALDVIEAGVARRRRRDLRAALRPDAGRRPGRPAGRPDHRGRPTRSRSPLTRAGRPHRRGRTTPSTSCTRSAR